MADGIRDFFRQYGAVPADDRGPNWQQASTAALARNLEIMRDACMTCSNPGRASTAFRGNRAAMTAVSRELLTRPAAERPEPFNDDSVLDLIIAICGPDTPDPELS